MAYLRVLEHRKMIIENDTVFLGYTASIVIVIYPKIKIQRVGKHSIAFAI